MSLPVPDIREDLLLQHAYKQARRSTSNRLRPPKVKALKRTSDAFNRSNSMSLNHSTALAISFRMDNAGDSISDEPDYVPLNCSSNSSSNNYINNNDNNNSSSYVQHRGSNNNEDTYFAQQFQCLEKIGEGSFGEVFKVRSKEDGKLYAVKMSKLLRGSHYRQERLEEVRRYEQFSGHENCVRFYRAWEQDECLYMQMELCRENLELYLERVRNVPEHKIWLILLDLLLAVKSLHDRNLIHLDIKLDNVLIGDDGLCKLADFGLVIDVDKANKLQATEGDSRYIAPEILQGIFSKAADIFSLGITMLELACCLQLPANGPLWHELRSGTLPKPLIDSVSSELLDVIQSMMSPDHLARPTVDQLLSYEKIAAVMNQRQRWKCFNDIGRNILANGSVVTQQQQQLNGDHTPPSKLAQHGLNGLNSPCAINQPNIYLNIVSSTPTQLHGNNTSRSDFPLDESALQLNASRENTPDRSARHHLWLSTNSTPCGYSSLGLRDSMHLQASKHHESQAAKSLLRSPAWSMNSQHDNSRLKRSASLGVEEMDNTENNSFSQGSENSSWLNCSNSSVNSFNVQSTPLQPRAKRLFIDGSP